MTLKQPASGYIRVGDIRSWKNIDGWKKEALGRLARWVHFGGCVAAISRITTNLFNGTYHESDKHRQLYNTCEAKIKSMTGMGNPLLEGLADIYFIPRKMKFGRKFKDSIGEAATLARLFFDNKYYLECAVPYIIRCLAHPYMSENIYGFSSWGHGRGCWKMKELGMVLDGHFNWIHPYKFTFILGDNLDDKEYFCTKVIPHFFAFETTQK